MQKKEDIIQENIELRSRLEFAEKWIRREIAGSISKIQKERSKKGTRVAITNLFEQDGIDILTHRILDQFDDSLDRAPKYSLERLIDAEIYWNTLQKYPQMDALPIILAYQKILDAWIEERLIVPFRNIRKNRGFSRTDSPLDIDIENILSKRYTLSIGRLYQIVSLIREGNTLTGNVGELVTFWKEVLPGSIHLFTSDDFFHEFSELMDRELFTRKRHESKVNYSDAKRIREIMVDGTERKSFLELIFSI